MTLSRTEFRSEYSLEFFAPKDESAVYAYVKRYFFALLNTQPDLLPLWETGLSRELEKIGQNGTCFVWRVLIEISEFAKRKNLPVFFADSGAGLKMAYLLGLSKVVPPTEEKAAYAAELLAFRNQQYSFTLWIPDELLAELESALAVALPSESQEGTMHKILLSCGGNMAQQLAKDWSDAKQLTEEDFEEPSFLQQILRSILENTLHNAQLWQAEHPEADCAHEELLQKLLYNYTPKSFQELVRLYGGIAGSFSVPKSMALFFEENHILLQDELCPALKELGIADDMIYDFAQRGVWSTGKKRERYVAVLQEHHAEKSLMDAFAETRNLWSYASCATRVWAFCAIAWQENR